MRGLLAVSLCVRLRELHVGLVIWWVSKATQCENHLPKVRKMWCGSALIINNRDNLGRNPSSGSKMGLCEDEAAIKAWMKRCKTIRPERMGGGKGGDDPGEQSGDGDRQRGTEQENGRRRRKTRGWVSHVCTPSKTVSVTHYHRTTSHPFSPLPYPPPPLLSLQLTH